MAIFAQLYKKELKDVVIMLIINLFFAMLLLFGFVRGENEQKAGVIGFWIDLGAMVVKIEYEEQLKFTHEQFINSLYFSGKHTTYDRNTPRYFTYSVGGEGI